MGKKWNCSISNLMKFFMTEKLHTKRIKYIRKKYNTKTYGKTKQITQKSFQLTMKTKDTSLLLTGMRSPYFSPSQNVWIYSKSSQAHRVIYIKKGRNILLFCNIHSKPKHVSDTHFHTFFLACLVNCNKQTLNCKLKQTVSDTSFWHFFTTKTQDTLALKQLCQIIFTKLPA